MRSSTQILPAEIKSQIAKYSSPATLSSFALVQKSFQHEAERELYATVAVTAYHSTSLTLTKLVETLSSNRKKAELIKFLTVEAPRSYTWENGSNQSCTSENYLAAKPLFSLLPKLTSLTDLRVMFLEEGDVSYTKELNAILTGRHFHLRSLFCNEWLDHAEIVKNQRDLKFLGIYECGGVTTIRLLKQLRAESVPIPITFSLCREGFYPQYDCISLFPAFLLPGTDQRLCRMLQPIFERDCDSYMTLASDRITQAFLFFETVRDTDYVADIILDMAKCFPNVSRLILFAQQPSKLEMEEIKQAITPVRKLRELKFCEWYKDEAMQAKRVEDAKSAIRNDKKLGYAQEWQGVCMDLQKIHFFDRVIVRKEEGRWLVR